MAKVQQEKDLSNQYYKKHCFYCHGDFKTTRSQFVDHLRSHGFQLGRPVNMVYIEKFVNVIEDIFCSGHCLFCGMKFPNTHELIEHMDKRSHNKINPENIFFDQFYMINYREYGKTWTDFCKEKLEKGQQERENKFKKEKMLDEEWSTWDDVTEHILCLFCKHTCRSWDGTLLHMMVLHNFDFKTTISPLQFYDQVKVVNYFRSQVMRLRCIFCNALFNTPTELCSHMDQNGHYQIPDPKYWNKSKYFFPTLNNDGLLYHLEDAGAENDWEDNIAECGDITFDKKHISKVSGSKHKHEKAGKDQMEMCGAKSEETKEIKRGGNEKKMNEKEIVTKDAINSSKIYYVKHDEKENKAKEVNSPIIPYVEIDVETGAKSRKSEETKLIKPAENEKKIDGKKTVTEASNNSSKVDYLKHDEKENKGKEVNSPIIPYIETEEAACADSDANTANKSDCYSMAGGDSADINQITEKVSGISINMACGDVCTTNL